MFVLVLDIKEVKDIEIVRAAIINNEVFTLGEIKPLTYKIILNGGRFKDYDTQYIDANVARIILVNQASYTKFLNEIEKKFDVRFTEKDKLIKFKLQKGSLEFISDIFNIAEVIKQMESQHIMYTILGLASMWFAHTSFNKKLETDIKLAEETKEIKLKELEGDEKKQYADMVNNAIAAMKDVMQDKVLQDAVNAPKKEMLTLLEDDEYLKLEDTEILRHANAPAFEYVRPMIEDIEEDPIDNPYIVESYNFYKEGKLFKLVGIPTLANSEVLGTEKRIKLMSIADKKEEVTLKVKITRDGITKRVKSIYILDIV